MFGKNIDNAIITLDKTATKYDVQFFKEMYPNSIIKIEGEPFTTEQRKLLQEKYCGSQTLVVDSNISEETLKFAEKMFGKDIVVKLKYEKDSDIVIKQLRERIFDEED